LIPLLLSIRDYLMYLDLLFKIICLEVNIERIPITATFQQLPIEVLEPLMAHNLLDSPTPQSFGLVDLQERIDEIEDRTGPADGQVLQSQSVGVGEDAGFDLLAVAAHEGTLKVKG
jgi:hypothetical protein